MASVGTFAAIQILLAVAEFGVFGPVAGASPLTFAKAPSPRSPVSALLTPSRYPRPRMAVSYVRSLHARRRGFRHAAGNGDDRATYTYCGWNWGGGGGSCWRLDLGFWENGSRRGATSSRVERDRLGINISEGSDLGIEGWESELLSNQKLRFLGALSLEAWAISSGCNEKCSNPMLIAV